MSRVATIFHSLIESRRCVILWFVHTFIRFCSSYAVHRLMFDAEHTPPLLSGCIALTISVSFSSSVYFPSSLAAWFKLVVCMGAFFVFVRLERHWAYTKEYTRYPWTTTTKEREKKRIFVWIGVSFALCVYWSDLNLFKKKKYIYYVHHTPPHVLH